MDRAAIIDATILTIEGLEVLLGDGLPISGAIFGQSSSMFSRSAEDQGSAHPDGNWTGSAADSYSNQNQIQQLREEILADVDYITGTLVSDQAKAVETARDVLSHSIHILNKWRPIAVDLAKVPLVGRHLSNLLQVLVCSYEMRNVLDALATLAFTTAENAAKLLAAIMQLAELLAELLADEANQFLSDLWSDVSQLLANLWSDLEAAWSELTQFASEFESELSGLPFLSSLSSLAGMTSSSGSTSLPGSASLAGLTPLSGAANSSGFGGIPTLGQLGGAGVQMQPRSTEFNPSGLGQSASQAQPLSSAAAPGSQAAPGGLPQTAMRRSGKDGEGENKGAASGASAAERVPIDTTTHAPNNSAAEMTLVDARE